MSQTPSTPIRDNFTASDFESTRPDGRFTCSVGYFMNVLRRMKPKLGLETVASAEEFPTWKAAVREKLRSHLRIGTEFKAEFKLLSTERRDGYRLCRYEFYPDELLAVGFIMLVPDDVYEGRRKAPAVICTPGHGGSRHALAGEPEVGSFPNRYPLRNRQAWYYVHAGMIAIAIENPAMAESCEPGLNWGHVTEYCYGLIDLTGRTYHGIQVEHTLMMLEFLKGNPMVDASRLALSGLSWGTGNVLYSSLLSDDVAAAVYNDFISSWAKRVTAVTEVRAARMWRRSDEPGSQIWFDDEPDLMAALAPLPIIYTEGGPMVNAIDKIRRAYELAGCPENLTVCYYRKYASPGSRLHDHEDVHRLTGITDNQYLDYCNVDARDHSFHPEVALPWLSRRFFGHADFSAELQAAIDESIAETPHEYRP